MIKYFITNYWVTTIQGTHILLHAFFEFIKVFKMLFESRLSDLFARIFTSAVIKAIKWLSHTSPEQRDGAQIAFRLPLVWIEQIRNIRLGGRGKKIKALCVSPLGNGIVSLLRRSSGNKRYLWQTTYLPQPFGITTWNVRPGKEVCWFFLSDFQLSRHQAEAGSQIESFRELWKSIFKSDEHPGAKEWKGRRFRSPLLSSFWFSKATLQTTAKHINQWRNALSCNTCYGFIAQGSSLEAVRLSVVSQVFEVIQCTPS